LHQADVDFGRREGLMTTKREELHDLRRETPEFVLRKGRYLLNTDGGMVNDGRRSSDDEPGEAAIGVVLRDSDDRPVTTFKERIGPETIQGAEYRALIEGLEIARGLKIGKIRGRSSTTSSWSTKSMT